MKNKSLQIYTDGGARGNPGPAACGVVIKDGSGQPIAKASRYLGETTNNQAEYQGVILALEKIAAYVPEEIDFYLDSQLVVSQLSGSFKVKDLGLQSLFVRVWNLSHKFKKIRYHHIPREMNKEADRLVNLELDKKR
ncbi:MAG: ribonuclease HI family protein [Candidatus Komeilibacteria bacterium]|nr:ribonuclease HI family protein [Candidatus Komeilibacteria bacterium]